MTKIKAEPNVEDAFKAMDKVRLDEAIYAALEKYESVVLKMPEMEVGETNREWVTTIVMDIEGQSVDLLRQGEDGRWWGPDGDQGAQAITSLQTLERIRTIVEQGSHGINDNIKTSDKCLKQLVMCCQGEYDKLAETLSDNDLKDPYIFGPKSAMVFKGKVRIEDAFVDQKWLVSFNLWQPDKGQAKESLQVYVISELSKACTKYRMRKIGKGNQLAYKASSGWWSWDKTVDQWIDLLMQMEEEKRKELVIYKIITFFQG